jgi:ubiquinone/menaquinone biosynthesis C-methylase UbiE
MAIGLDFSPELITVARQRAISNGVANVAAVLGNARNIPLRGSSISLLFSFACLYHIPAVEHVITECARILRRGGVAILEFGAFYSLNTIVSRAYPELAAPCHVPLRKIHAMLSHAGFVIEMHRPFQLLPFWGNRPWWLRPLLHPIWKRMLQQELAGRMLDEWISALWPFRLLAFRHLMICRRT